MHDLTDNHSQYYEAMHQADEDLAAALTALRIEEDSRSVTTAQAAARRVGLLERHIEHCQQLRRAHLGGSS